MHLQNRESRTRRARRKEGWLYFTLGIVLWLFPNIIYKVWYGNYDAFPVNCN